MAREASKANDDVKESLIPVIKAEEDRLKRMLDEAKAEAARLVREAEGRAEARVEEMKQGLPRFITGRREEAIREIEAQAAAERDTSDSEADEIRRGARSNMDGAVAHIVSMVWPGGRP